MEPTPEQQLLDAKNECRRLNRRVQEIDESRALAEKNCAAAELELARWVDLSAQLLALYPQATSDDRRDVQWGDSLRGLARWFTAHVPADLARLRRHSRALQAVFRRELHAIAVVPPTAPRDIKTAGAALAVILKGLEADDGEQMLDDFASLLLDDWPPKPPTGR